MDVERIALIPCSLMRPTQGFTSIYPSHHYAHAPNETRRMKIQCSFCSKEEASVFCTADDAALCDICDRRVHHANSSRHKRFSLLPSSSSSCDICRDKGAILFCKEDRAILCKDCDYSIHKVNEHTRKHYRFLLTGLKLSASATEYPHSSPPPLGLRPPYYSSSTTPPPLHSDTSIVGFGAHPPSTTSTLTKRVPPSTSHLLDVVPATTSSSDQPNQSLSQYLMETLPGWTVDDFLDPSSSPSPFTPTQFPDHGGCVVGTTHHHSSFPSEQDFAASMWVPEQDIPDDHLPLYLGINGGAVNASEESNKLKVNRRRIDVDGFAVPEIRNAPPPKKSRSLW